MGHIIWNASNLGTAAAFGLILFFVCALYTHVRASDYSSQFGLYPRDVEYAGISSIALLPVPSTLPLSSSAMAVIWTTVAVKPLWLVMVAA